MPWCQRSSMAGRNLILLLPGLILGQKSHRAPQQWSLDLRLIHMNQMWSLLFFNQQCTQFVNVIALLFLFYIYLFHFVIFSDFSTSFLCTVYAIYRQSTYALRQLSQVAVVNKQKINKF